MLAAKGDADGAAGVVADHGAEAAGAARGEVAGGVALPVDEIGRRLLAVVDEGDEGHRGRD